MTDPIVKPTPSHWGIITAGDIQAEQARTLTAAQQDNVAVQACIASGAIDSVTGQQWTIFYNDLTTFCQKPVINIAWPWTWGDNSLLADGDTGETMMAYEAQLVAWENRLHPKCPSVGSFQQLVGVPPTSDNAAAIVKWIAIGLVAVAGAYVVSKIAPPLLGLLPQRRQGKSNPIRRRRRRNPLKGKAGPRRSGALIRKATNVRIFMPDGRVVRPSGSMMHDPSGRLFPSRSLIIGPFRKSMVSATDKQMSGAPRAYLGGNYRGRMGSVRLPPKDIRAWRFVGDVSRGGDEDGEIQYTRTGSRARGGFYHGFNKSGLTQAIHGKGRVRLYRCGSFYRLELPRGAVVDDRGFVWP